MRLNIIISLLSLLIITFSSCKKNPAAAKVYVPDYLKAMAPYTNGQSVSFSNGSGQVVNAIVSITSTFAYSGSFCSSCASAPNHENITYSLNAGTNKFIVFNIDPTTFIGLNIYSPVDNYQFATGFSFSVESGVSQGSCFAQRQVCLPSVTLNGKTFTNVLEIAAVPGPSPLVKAYHTVSQGIVGFRYANGTTYNLE